MAAVAVALLAACTHDSGLVGSTGLHWQLQESGTDVRLTAVWGSSNESVWAVGDHGVILHYDGSGWTPVNSGTTNDLLDIWGTGDDNVYVVGRQVLLHWDGARWASQIDTLGASLSGIHGLAADNIIAVGYPDAIIRYNGTGWTADTGSVPYYTDVWMTRQVIHPAVPAPETVYFTGEMNVWASAWNDVYRLGNQAWHFNGSVWERLGPYDSGARPMAAHGSSPKNVFMVGMSGYIWHFDGDNWKRQQLDKRYPLRGIWVDPDTDEAFAVGHGGTIAHLAIF